MELTKTLFSENLARLNALRFEKWIFEPGMLYLSENKWWGEKGQRGLPHNGLDIRLYESAEGTVETLCAGSRIPLVYGGRILAVMKDFLGFSLFAAHEIYDEDFRLYTIYGHVIPAENIAGEFLAEGSVIAHLAGPSSGRVPGHLHISVAFMKKDMRPERLTWENIDKSGDVKFIDPKPII